MAAVLATVGCQADPGAVAYVGDAQITQRQLDEAVSGVQQTLQPGQQVATAAVVNGLIHGEIADQVAAKHKITVTDAEREKVLATSTLAPLLQVPAAKGVAFDVATQQIVAQKVGAEAYLADVVKTPVTLNPRFGVLNEEDKTIVDSSSGSLSVPASSS